MFILLRNDYNVNSESNFKMAILFYKTNNEFLLYRVWEIYDQILIHHDIFDM